MKIKLTKNAPILMKLIPETPTEVYMNETVSKILASIKISFKTEKDGVLILNIGPTKTGGMDESYNFSSR